MFPLPRDWLLGMTLGASVLGHALFLLMLGSSRFQPPVQAAPRQGKASIRLLPSVEARRIPTPEAPRKPQPVTPVETVVRAEPEVLPLPAVLLATAAEVLPLPQERETIPEPTPLPAKPDKDPPAKTKQLAQTSSRASPASQASEGAIDQLPAEAVNPAPPYPPAARAAGQQGIVTVRVKVDAAGRVSAASVQESSGYALLDESALRTVQRWVFHPARRNGRAVACVIDKPFEFFIRQ